MKTERPFYFKLAGHCTRCHEPLAGDAAFMVHESVILQVIGVEGAITRRAPPHRSGPPTGGHMNRNAVLIAAVRGGCSKPLAPRLQSFDLISKAAVAAVQLRGGCGGPRKAAENKAAAVLWRLMRWSPHTPLCAYRRRRGRSFDC
jgi:hypothetical protein